MAEPILAGGGNASAGSEAERRRARELERRLTEVGRDAHIEPIRVRPAFGLTHAIHAVLGIVASVLSVYHAGIGFIVAAAATVSAFGDVGGAFYLVRSLTPARASQNVVSDEDNGKPGLIVLVAHYDQPRAGTLLGPRLAPLWPRALVGSLALISACALLRVVGIEAGWLTVLQFIPTVVLIVLTPLFADVAVGEPSDATNEDEVAAVLQLADAYANRLEHFDVMALFTGASAHDALGMRNWLKRHRKELETEATAVITFDPAHESGPHYAAKEGPIFTSRMHSMLIDFADDSAEAFNSHELSDAYLARASSLPALRLSSTDGYDFAADLLARIDEEIGPRLA